MGIGSPRRRATQHINGEWKNIRLTAQCVPVPYCGLGDPPGWTGSLGNTREVSQVDYDSNRAGTMQSMGTASVAPRGCQCGAHIFLELPRTRSNFLRCLGLTNRLLPHSQEVQVAVVNDRDCFHGGAVCAICQKLSSFSRKMPQTLVRRHVRPHPRSWRLLPLHSIVESRRLGRCIC
jgi:hypothetical protein